MADPRCDQIWKTWCVTRPSTASRVQYTLRRRQRIESSGLQIVQSFHRVARRDIMQRKASAVWQGDLKSGKGYIPTDSGVLKQTPYSFSTRFENGVGTNPEELIAAAHAGCFTMALSAELEKAGFTADTPNTTAAVPLETHPQTSWTVTKIHLTNTAKVPGIAADKFAAIAAGAKAGCPI